MTHLLGKLCNYGVEHLKLEHLPAGRRVTERKEKEYQVSCVRRPVAQIPFRLV
ncbi:MAG: hypothetical protein JRI41_00045 [Deltaproteobacteria bacterium]|nr:hypothetical protein [Deltaproteobacteria bacterium]